VQLAPPGVGMVRALTDGSACPVVRFDGRAVRMARRAAPDSDFSVLTCEAPVPPGTRRIEIGDKTLRPPVVRPERIAVIGDTGCRLKAGGSLDDGFQACNDPDAWEFAKVAQQVAAWGPDLIIQVGDYIYREQPCARPGCEGSPFNSPGMRRQTWEADYFQPAAPMLEAAPIVFVRGDHEQCERAGKGFFRFLDPFPLRECMDFTAPYALDFENVQLVVMDTVQAGDTPAVRSPDVVVDTYRRDFERVSQLATGNTWLLGHRPLWGVRPTTPDGANVEVLNVTLQQALSRPLPASIDLVLTGHVHLAEVLSFTGNRPPQAVVGTGGTLLLPGITRTLIGMDVDRELVAHATIISRHGFVTFEPSPRGGWEMTIRNEVGTALVVCRVADRSAVCPSD
jgi:calcineurin-like phosphoesterase family protein